MAGNHIALIRGINVGRAKRVAMADLRALFEDLGYHRVRTLLNSGNVIFSASDIARQGAGRIESALAERLAISARVTLFSAAELAAAVAANPLRKIADDPSRLLVGFLKEAADCKRLARLTDEDWEPEALALGPRVAYLWCPEGIIASRLMKSVDRVVDDAITTRNWATVIKLHALATKEDCGEVNV